MLRLFSEALGDYLAARLSDMPEKPVSSFSLPGTVAERNALSIYLTFIAEDAELRSNEEQYERTELGWISNPPPLRLKCTYVVSAWPTSDHPAEAALVRLRLLGRAFALFASVGALPAAYLPAPMKASGLSRPVITLSKDDLPRRPEFWTSAGCVFQPAFAFAATISLPVTEERYDDVVEKVKIDYQTGM